MTENAVKPVMFKKPKPPLELYKTTFCKHCSLKCNINSINMQTCVLTLLADELTRLRQLLQTRTQHLAW